MYHRGGVSADTKAVDPGEESMGRAQVVSAMSLRSFWRVRETVGCQSESRAHMTPSRQDGGQAAGDQSEGHKSAQLSQEQHVCRAWELSSPVASFSK